MLFKVDPLKLVENKSILLREFREILTSSEIERGSRDDHAKRIIRWCGLTVHFTVNCPFNCSYCYIEDMGFRFSNPKPYPLSGKELSYALLLNPAFLPGRTGTLIAIGSVSEPFIFLNDALDKIEWLARLRNPIQFSTKQYIPASYAEKLKEISERYNTPISPLVTIITLENPDSLEKNAPSPEKRFDSIKNLRDAGLFPILFLRPLIPCVNLHEVNEILIKAKRSGAIGAVVGGFRVTARILKRLKDHGVDISEIEKRMKITDNIQRSVPIPEKRSIIKKIKELGMIPWASACCANSWNAKVPCPSTCFIRGPCTKCPNNCSYPRDVPDADEVELALLKLGVRVKVRGTKVILENYLFRGVEMLVRNISRRIPIVKKNLRKGK